MEIAEIEKKIVELKLKERALLEKRTKARVPLLFNADNLSVVNNIIEKFFVGTMGINRRSVRKDYHAAGSGGRNNEEHLSVIEVIVRSDEMTEKCEGCRSLAVSVVVDSGFEDERVREEESAIMDEIISVRARFEELLALKKSRQKPKNTGF